MSHDLDSKLYCGPYVPLCQTMLPIKKQKETTKQSNKTENKKRRMMIQSVTPTLPLPIPSTNLRHCLAPILQVPTVPIPPSTLTTTPPPSLRRRPRPLPSIHRSRQRPPQPASSRSIEPLVRRWRPTLPRCLPHHICLTLRRTASAMMVMFARTWGDFLHHDRAVLAQP